MSDHQHEETQLRGYDAEIARRLLGFLRPYAATAIMALVALVIASAADLLLPIIVQRTVDNHFLSDWRRLPLDARAEVAEVDERHIITIGDHYYVRDSRLTVLSGVQRARLESSGILDSTSFYLFRATEESLAVVAALPAEQPEERYFIGDEYVALRQEVLDGLDPQSRRILTAGDLNNILRNGYLYLLLLIITMGFSFCETYLMAYAGQGVMLDMRVRLFDHTLHQSLGFIGVQPVGKLTTRITNDVETINELFSSVVSRLARNVIMIIGVIVVLFVINYRLALVTLASLPPAVVITYLFRRWAREAYRAVRTRVSQVNAFLAEHIAGIAAVQSFVREARSNRRFRRLNGSLREANIGEMYVFAVYRPLVDLFSSVSLACILYFGASFLLQGVVSLGVMIAYISLVERFYRQFVEISDLFVSIQSAMAGGERLFAMLDTQERIPDHGTEQLPPVVTGALELRSLSFAYKPNEPVLTDLNIRLDPGETLAVVGFTGAGKTTIANLLTRLWDVNSGSILLDGIDIRHIPLETLRTTIQPIQQDVFLFRDTIRNNMTLGLDIPFERVRDMAALAQADTFIRRLPKQYETIMLDGGSNLSGGTASADCICARPDPRSGSNHP